VAKTVGQAGIPHKTLANWHKAQQFPLLSPLVAERTAAVAKKVGHHKKALADKAAALAVIAACDGNLTEAARQTGIPRNTLSDWHKRQQQPDQVSPPLTEVRHHKKALADRLAQVERNKPSRKKFRKGLANPATRPPR
jgi:Bacterial regulatory protein, Fis family